MDDGTAKNINPCGTKHLLVVSDWYYPEISPRAFRVAELVKEFARRGHRVTLVLPDRRLYRDNPLPIRGVEVLYGLDGKKGRATHSTTRPAFSDASANVEVADSSANVPASKVLTTSNDTTLSPVQPASGKQKGLFSRLLPQFLKRWMLYFYCHELYVKYDKGLAARLLTLDDTYDAVISVSYPAAVHLAVSRAFRRNPRLARAVKIAEFSDPPFKGDVVRNVHPAYYRYLRRWGREFDYFVVPVEKAVGCYTPYIAPERVKVIPQGFDFSAVRTCPYVPHDKPVFAYAGRFYENIRDPRFFFDFLKTVERDFRFDLYLNDVNPYFRAMIEASRAQVRGEIVLHDSLPREELIAELSKADFLVNFENTTPNATPSKLIDYALTGRPVLSVRRDSFDPQAVLDFMRGDYTAQERGIRLADYDIRTVTDQFMELIG